MSLKLTAIAALLATVSAIRCGQMKVTTCDDDECSVNCKTEEMEFQSCSQYFIKEKQPGGSVHARCDYQKTTFKFFQDETCTQGQYRMDKEYYYGICYPNPYLGGTGSLKIEEGSGDRPEFYELTEEEYEERFNQRWKDTSDFNVLGYGRKNPFIPPIRKVNWMVNEWDRWTLALRTPWFMPFLSEAFIKAFYTRDYWNGFTWYNNAQAAGQQLYPSGINKYFDLFSFNGWVNYVFYWGYAMVTELLTPFTLLPINIWIGILEGYNWENWWYAFVPDIFIWIFHLRGQNGWILA